MTLPEHRASKEMPLLAKVLRSYLRSGVRGQTRLTLMLAGNMKSLQSVPIQIADWSPLYVDLRDHSSHELLANSPYAATPRENDEQGVMRRVVKRGDMVFDVGANIGIHTLLLSQLVGPEGKVYAFEPNKDLLPTLQHTVSWLRNTSLLNFALSDRSDTADFFVPFDKSMGSLADWSEPRGGQASRVSTCELRRIDDLIASGVLAQPDFMKVDTEGAELSVFQGGRRTLDRPDAPIIFFESNVYTARGFGLDISASRDYLAQLELPRYVFLEMVEGGAGRVVRKDDFHPVHSMILAVPQAKMSGLDLH